MAKRKKVASRRPKVGQPPGTPIHITDQPTGLSSYSFTRYNGNTISLSQYSDVSEFKEMCEPNDQILWVHADGQPDLKQLEALGNQFHIHPLTLEDLVNNQHRPKVEVFDQYIHFVIKALSYDAPTRSVHENQINVILGSGFVLSVSEVAARYFEPIFNRLKSGRGIVRNMKEDYLAYCLLDYVVDNYFLVMEACESVVEEIESQVFDDAAHPVVGSLYEIKRQVHSIRKTTGPARDFIASIRRQKTPLIRTEVESYFNDLFDHISEVHDSFNGLRLSLISLVDVSFANSSERASSVMKVLAVISVIFLPLNFLVGVFGMNFSHMPGLNWPYSFSVMVGLMVASTFALAVFFKRKAWW